VALKVTFNSPDRKGSEKFCNGTLYLFAYLANVTGYIKSIWFLMWRPRLIGNRSAASINIGRHCGWHSLGGAYCCCSAAIAGTNIRWMQTGSRQSSDERILKTDLAVAAVLYV